MFSFIFTTPTLPTSLFDFTTQRNQLFIVANTQLEKQNTTFARLHTS
jgi:hypothetical protein